MKKKAYIAFSIHGTCAFIIATNTVHSSYGKIITKAPEGEFTIAFSRNPVKTDDLKLHWSKLMKADGTPHTDPRWVIRRFNQLEKAGWKVDREVFVKKHFT
jgi:hypothetical protein